MISPALLASTAVAFLDLPDAIGRDLSWPAFGWLLALSIPTAFLWLARRRT